MDDSGREYDIAELIKAYNEAGSHSARQNIYHAAMRIRNETGRVRSMREALIKAHRNNDTEEIKDIHDYISNKSEYK